jgi:hypothetical protein
MGLWKSGWLLILLDQLNVGFSTLFVVPTKVLKKQQEAENIQVHLSTQASTRFPNVPIKKQKKMPNGPNTKLLFK